MKTFNEFIEELDESADDKFSKDAYSTTRGNVVKSKSGGFLATNKSGSTKHFSSEKAANIHASKKSPWDSGED